MQRRVQPGSVFLGCLGLVASDLHSRERQMNVYAALVLSMAALATTFRGLYLPCPYHVAIVDIPAARSPHPSPLTGPYAPNNILSKSNKLWVGANNPGGCRMFRKGMLASDEGGPARNLQAPFQKEQLV